MFERPARPFAERVLGLDAHLEAYGVVLRLAVAGTLNHHDELLATDFHTYCGPEGVDAAAAATAKDFVLHKERLHDSAAAAASDLRPAAAHPDAGLSLQVAVELCEALASATAPS